MAKTDKTTPTSRIDSWNLGLWIAQAVLAFMFLYAGFMKLIKTPEALDAMGWHWALDLPHALILFIGVMEVLGAIGILLPAATPILPVLTRVAAAGMVLLQVSAIVLHATRGEVQSLPLNLILLILALLVVWGRTRKAVIEAR